MKKNVFILNHYASTMMFNKGGRHYWFAKYLKRQGYNPVIFSCNTVHNAEKNFIDSDELWTVRMAEEIDTPFVFVKASSYKENGVHRIINMFSFYKNVQKAVKAYAAKYGKPDIIYASSVHPLTLVAGLKLAKKYKIKCICEVRDLWPEAIVAYSKRLKKSNPFVKLLYQGEKWIYKKGDALIFTQEGGLDYIREHKWDKEHGGPIDMRKAFHINNGVDLEAFDANLAAFPYADDDLDNPGLFKVVYAGSIRRINNLGIILDSAKLIKNPKIKFLIFGSGDESEALQKRVIDENIGNVVFKGRVNKQFIPSVDNKADLNLVHWEMNPLLRVGESYNKAFEYYAAGKPVFYTIRPGYSIAEKYNSGKITEGFTPADIAKGIEAMAAMSEEEKTAMAENARKTAEIYDFKNLTAKLIKIIEETC